MYFDLQIPDYINMCQCLMFLNDAKRVADVMNTLLNGDLVLCVCVCVCVCVYVCVYERERERERMRESFEFRHTPVRVI